MKLEFTKMHGCGNDYIYVNCTDKILNNPSSLAIKLSRRNFSIGSDGLVLILPSQTGDFRMQMFNADGSEGLMCGNALRCIAKYVYEKGLTNKEELLIETASGVKKANLSITNNIVNSICIDLGAPIFEAQAIPVKSTKAPVIIESITIKDQTFNAVCVSMGNPHAVIFVPEITDELVLKIGPQIEKLDIFPERTNVEFVKVLSANEVNMRVWERGSGETLACGSGAAAVCVAGSATEQLDRSVKVNMLGGQLLLNWDEQYGNVYMTGPAEFAFDGVVEV